MNRAAPALALVLGLALPAGPVLAQSNTGTSFGQFMQIEPSARIAAMGNAGVAIAEGIQGIYYNPAALGGLEGPALQFTHSFWFADIRYDYAAVGLPIGNLGNFFGSVTALNSGDVDVRTVEFPLGTG